MSRRQDRKAVQTAQRQASFARLQARRQAELEVGRLYYQLLCHMRDGTDAGVVVAKLMELTGLDAMQVGTEVARRHQVQLANEASRARKAAEAARRPPKSHFGDGTITTNLMAQWDAKVQDDRAAYRAKVRSYRKVRL